MLRPVQFIRLFQINLVIMRHGFTRTVIGKQSPMLRSLRFLSYLNPFSFLKHGKTRGEAVRLGLERLGPIFVKFGQLLSTRRDLLPEDIIAELSKLQDRVPPFPGLLAKTIIEKSFAENIDTLFAQFDETPLASASIAQVHAATMHDGASVVVKVIRPNIEKVIRHDIAIMYQVAKYMERFWKQGKRLHPIDLVREFEQTILDELDLMREAANASQLRRNFDDSEMLYVPKIYWSHTRQNVMVMERIYGVPIADMATLQANKVNMKKLAEYGVTIFFTQVFRDSFFHADMHPGNLFIDIRDPDNPKYLGVDFGIMGTLSPSDQHYLAGNILAFFNRDYRQVALLHVESGWVPADTRVDQFESAIRTVCEPIFARPLKDISFGQLLLRLFQTAERFQMEIQPQLMLLQKTLLSIEGLGRMLYPELDLWVTAKPFMKKWMRERQGLRNLSQLAVKDWRESAEKIIKTPSLLFDVLHDINYQQRLRPAAEAPIVIKQRSRLATFLLGAGTSTLAVLFIGLLRQPTFWQPLSHWQLAGLSASVALLLAGLLLPRS